MHHAENTICLHVCEKRSVHVHVYLDSYSLTLLAAHSEIGH